MTDLLDRGGKEMRVLEDAQRRTRVLGLRWRAAAGSEDFVRFVEAAQERRATRPTQTNATSSRSHWLLRVGFQPEAPLLTFVDCAGSERRQDSSHHDAQNRKDGAEINSTIFALKECFRALRSGKGQPPFRESLLTRVLSDTFPEEEAMVAAIGTVGPCSADTEHTLGTLRALQVLQGTQMSSEQQEDVQAEEAATAGAPPQVHHPRLWSEASVRRWLLSAAAGQAGAFAAAAPRGTDGRQLVRWPLARFVQLCGGSEALGRALYRDLRNEMGSGKHQSGLATARPSRASAAAAISKGGGTVTRAGCRKLDARSGHRAKEK